MLRVELHTLEKKDVVLDETAPAKTLGVETDPRFSLGPIQIHCELSKRGEYILATGWVRGRRKPTCDRCLKAFDEDFNAFLEVQYRPGTEPAEEGEFEAGEAELVYFEGEVLDVTDAVRQAVLLSVPMRTLCREDCKGLCGGCGADLNREPCGCTGKGGDNRWSVLKGWKPRT